MNRFTRRALALLLGALIPTVSALAAQPADPELQRLQESLAKRLPPQMVGPLRATEVDGLYEMQLQSRLVYVTRDGRFLIQGEIFDLAQSRNLTRERRTELREQAMAAVGEDQMLVYEPDQTRFQVTVFTDIDCPYCREMHGEMAEYLKRGIRIRYLFYPRSGPDTPSHAKAVSVWCAEDRHAAMDAAMAGGNPKAASCANPVDQHLELGEQMGISGTPALVLDGGVIVPGYVPPERLLNALEMQADNKQ